MACSRLLYPNEIASLYKELRCLTEEMNNYYGCHIILATIDSVLIFVSCTTALTLDYTNGVQLTFSHNNLFIFYCIFKLLFLYFVVQEIHETICEVSNCVRTEIVSILHYITISINVYNYCIFIYLNNINSYMSKSIDNYYNIRNLNHYCK